MGGIADGAFKRNIDPTLTALQFEVLGGQVTDNLTLYQVPDTILTLADDIVTTIVLDIVNGAIVDNTTLLSDEGRIALYDVTTASGVITVVDDLRSMFTEKETTFIDDFEAELFKIDETPYHRFLFNQASGNLTNVGDSGEGVLTASGTVTYEEPGLDTGIGGNTLGIEYDGSTGATIHTSYGPTSNGTGTAFILFKADPADTGSRHSLWSMGNSSEGLALEYSADNGTVLLIQYNALAEASTSWVRSMTPERGGIDVSDGEWHTVAVAKNVENAVAGTDAPRDYLDMWIDGLYMNTIPGWLDLEGASAEVDTWFDTMSGGGSTFAIGKDQANTSVPHFDGTISEFFYLDGTVITNDHAFRLHASLGLDQGVSSPTETLLFRRIREARVKGHFRFDDASGSLTDSAGLIGDIAVVGTPNFETSFITGESAVEYDGTGVATPENHFAASGSSVGTVNKGWLIGHFAIADNTGATNQELWINANSGGQPYHGMRAQTTETLILFLVETGGFGVNEYRYSLDLSETGSGDLHDDAWHQIIMYQADDGTGIVSWFDGEKILPSDDRVTEEVWGAGTIDRWLDTTQTTHSFAASAKAPFSRYMNGKLSNWAWSDEGEVMTDTYAANLWAATGL